jgi:Tfp pilus assembly PilM family ATPase
MPRFLAIDWDQNQLHVVAAEVRNGSVKILRAAVWQEQQSPNVVDAEALGKLLRQRLREADIPAAPVLVCVGRDRVILKEVKHPPVPETEEPALVRFQAVKELTEPADEVVIDYMPLGDRSEPGERRSLVQIIRRDIVTAWRRICQHAGLKLDGVTPRSFGIASCLRNVMGTTALTPPPNPLDAAVAVAVVGERWSEFLVMRGSKSILLARTVAVGGNVAGEIRRNLAVYAGQAGQQPVSAMYLAGAITPDLRQRLADMLPDLPLHPFDPFPGADLPTLEPVARGAFAGAVGLLHLKSEKAGLPINFVQPRQPKPPADNRKQLVLAGFAILVLLLGGGVFGSFHLKQRRQVELDNYIADREEVEGQLAQLREDHKRLKTISEWETAVSLDELFDLTDRIKNLNVLRIKDITIDAIDYTPSRRYASRITMKLVILDRNAKPNPVDAMLDEFRKDGYYSVAAPIQTNNEVTVTVSVKRRPPTDYERKGKEFGAKGAEK